MGVGRIYHINAALSLQLILYTIPVLTGGDPDILNVILIVNAVLVHTLTYCPLMIFLCRYFPGHIRFIDCTFALELCK